MGKVEQWQCFSKIVEEHIDSYVVGQYGDFYDSMIANWTPEKIQGKLEHLVARIGRGQRGEKEQHRDFLKIAHFACYLYMLTKYGDAQMTPSEYDGSGDEK